MDETRPEARDEPVYRTVREPRLKLLIPLVVACAMLMDGLDQTIIVTSLPQIARSLGESPLRLNLAITSYLLSLAVFIPVSGWIADRFGARTVFCTAVGIFTVSSALCGASMSLTMMVATRILQGVGGALMSPVGRLVMLKSFPRSETHRGDGLCHDPGDDRAGARGRSSAAFSPPTRRGGGSSTSTCRSARSASRWRCGISTISMPIRIARFDVKGFVLCGVGLAACQLALEFAGRLRVGGGIEVAFIAVAVLSLTAYAFYARRTHAPVVDLELFRIKTFRIGNVRRHGGAYRLWLDVVPAAAAAADRARVLGLPFRPLYVIAGGGRAVDAHGDAAGAAALRVPRGAARERRLGRRADDGARAHLRGDARLGARRSFSSSSDSSARCNTPP